MKELQSCETRYWHRKVNATPPDEDYTPSESLGLGKAFHKVLEDFNHTGWNESALIKAMGEFNCEEDDRGLLAVMLDKYLEFRKASGLKVVLCEFGIETQTYVGYCDAIAIEPSTKLWWIVDLKTTARHDPNLVPQLAKDMQIGLYSHFAGDIEATTPALEGYTFGGFRYCQVVKSKAQTLSGLQKGVKVFEMVIPSEVIDTENSWRLFSEIHDRATDLNKGEAPRKNYSSCFSYFSPCQFFSKCHGNLFTKGNPKVQVLTIDTLNDGDLL